MDKGMTRREVKKKIKHVPEIAYLHKMETRAALLNPKTRESIDSILNELYETTLPSMADAPKVLDKAVKRNNKKLIGRLGEMYASDFYTATGYEEDLPLYHFDEANYCYKLLGDNKNRKKLADRAYNIRMYGKALQVYKEIGDFDTIREKAESSLDFAKDHARSYISRKPNGFNYYGDEVFKFFNRGRSYYNALEDKGVTELKSATKEIGDTILKAVRKFKDEFNPYYLCRKKAGKMFYFAKRGYDDAAIFYQKSTDAGNDFNDLIKEIKEEKEEFHQSYSKIIDNLKRW